MKTQDSGVITCMSKTELAEEVEGVQGVKWYEIFEQPGGGKKRKNQDIQSPAGGKLMAEVTDAGPTYHSIHRRLEYLEKAVSELEELKRLRKQVVNLAKDAAAKDLRCFLRAILNAVEKVYAPVFDPKLEKPGEVLNLIISEAESEKWRLEQDGVIGYLTKQRSFRITPKLLENLSDMRNTCHELSTGIIHQTTLDKVADALLDDCLLKPATLLGKMAFGEVFKFTPEDIRTGNRNLQLYITDLD